MGITQRGVVSVARAMGRVAGVLAGALRMRRWPARGSGRKVSERNALLAEIARIERELDQVYYEVARGDGGPEKNESDPAGPGLSEILSRARDMQEQLRKARARLNRLDRDVAMNRRFLRSLFSGSRSPDENLPDIGKTAQPRKRYDFEDEEGEFEFESLLEGDL